MSFGTNLLLHTVQSVSGDSLQNVTSSDRIFHHAMGATDGKQVAFQKPLHAGSDFFSCKRFNSIITFAVVDTNYKLIWLSIGTNRATGDAQR